MRAAAIVAWLSRRGLSNETPASVAVGSRLHARSLLSEALDAVDSESSVAAAADSAPRLDAGVLRHRCFFWFADDVTLSSSSSAKRGSYRHHSPNGRFDVPRRACRFSPTAAVRLGL
jgi:hypothetical protein